jgi:predicted DNA-binding protein with PD1-like motif
MQYQIGSTGRVVVARFEDGEDVLASIRALAREHEIRSAIFHLVGGLKGGRFVVGPEEDGVLPPKPSWRSLEESHEILATGTIFFEGDEPKLHMHGAFGKHDSVKVGCLREGSETFLVLEAFIIEVVGIKAERVMDPKVGLPLLKLG